MEQHIRIRLGHDILASVNAIQGDTGREFYFYFDDYIVPDDAELRVYVRKPSGAEIYNHAYISNGEVVIQPTYQMLAEVGASMGQIQVIIDSKLITSFAFQINITESLISSSSIPSSDEFLILDELITNARELNTELNSLIETVTSQEATRVSNENKRKSAETSRVSAEKNRVTEFNSIKEEFATLKTQSSSATNSANAAASKANTAANAANAAADRANEIADALEDATSGLIDDNATSTLTTYSSNKIMSELQKIIISSSSEPSSQIINGIWLKEM